MAVNKSFILFDDYQRDHLLPFTYTRPVAEIRVGILTIREKWEKWTSRSFSYKTQDYLQEKFALVSGQENLVINGCVTPNHQLVDEVMQLRCGEVLMKDSFFVAGCLDQAEMVLFNGLPPKGHAIVKAKSEFRNISRTWQIFRLNGVELESDFSLLTGKRKSAPLSATNRVINPENVFVEAGASLECVTINASTGPVYIGSNAVAMEGSLIRGSFALCEGATVKMGTRIYGPTTIGPYSKVGGEITNSVIMGYTYKVHDGYMGNSVIGAWCNFGAGSNTSNLKNNYTLLPVWDYSTGKAEETGLQFCGLIMGDYSRCGINTMFNTGTVVGISSNIFGPGFPGNFIPSFSWGGAAGFETYRLANAIETIRIGMELHKMVLSETDKKMIEQIFMRSGHFRK